MINSSNTARREGQPTVVRLAWIVDDRDTLMLLHRSLLWGAMERRHKVLVLTPYLDSADRLSLMADGIESDLIEAGGGFNPFAARTARHRLAQTLTGWGANAVMIDSGPFADLAVRACDEIGITRLYAMVPALDPAMPQQLMQWQRALKFAEAGFVATTGTRRLIAAELGENCPPLHLMPPMSAGLELATPVQLPSIGSGLIFVGLRRAAMSILASAVGKLDGRALNVRFRLADGGGEAGAARHTDAQQGRCERFELDLSDIEKLTAAVQAAHVVVIDGTDAAHIKLMGIALASGRPVLAVDSALNRDVIDAGVDGWLVAADASALADAITGILKRPDLLAGMARAAHLKATRRFTRQQSEAALFGGIGLADLRIKAA